jgi:hypothetical protein
MGFIEPQTFHIGALLAEIGLSCPIEGIKQQPNKDGDEYDLVMSFKYKGIFMRRSLPAKDIVMLVAKSRMGVKYTKAVEFCLQQSAAMTRPEWQQEWQDNGWEERERAYQGEILSDYYSEVYER